VLALQRAAGNAAVAHLLDPRPAAQVQRRGGSTGSQAVTDGGTTGGGTESPELSERLDGVERRYREMITAARGRGADVAADNLERFLAGTGGVKTESVPWLRGFEVVTDAEETNEDRFEKSLNDLANGMSHGDRRTHADHWSRMLTASRSSELFYASGTSTIRSTGTFDLNMIENVVSVYGTVEHTWYDPYDWHAGLTASVPGFGTISDEDALLMQRHRGARPFRMEATWTRRVTGSIEVGTLWNTRSLSWSGP
jgi:hypothetical protein